MDQPLDFSFHKGNPLAVVDGELESPKPMPKPPPLPQIADENAEQTADTQENSQVSIVVEVIESLSISPTMTSADGEGVNCDPSSSCSTASTSLPAVNDDANVPSKAPTNVPLVPRFSDGAQASFPKPKPRAKIPLEKGFTQVDWLKLARTEPDLAGLKGGTNRRLITKAEVKQHRSEDDAWTILKGQVYNVTPYLTFHPGGKDMLMKGAGRDCTALFEKYHSWVNAEYLLEKCMIGFLDVEN